MARPPKPHLVLADEKKSHRTKAEMEQRKKGEEALLTGVSMKEWPDVKTNPIAHKEFARIRKLLKRINHDDALHENIINRYCLLHAECKRFEGLEAQLVADIQELRGMRARDEIEPLVYLDQKGSLQDRVLAVDKRLMEKRKMQLSIEKENIMTIMGALRAVPKTPDKTQEKSKMASFLEKRQAK